MKFRESTKSLLTGSTISIIAKGIDVLLSYLLVILISRMLGPEMLGRYYLLIGVVLVFSELGRAGLDTVMVKLGAELFEQKAYGTLKSLYATLASRLLIIGSILTCIGFFAAPFIAEFIYNKPHLTTSLQFAALAILPYMFLALLSQGLRASKKFLAYSIATEISTPLLSIIIVLALRTVFTPSTILLFVLVGAIISTCLAFIPLWHRTLRFSQTVGTGIFPLNQIRKIANPLVPSIIASLILNWGAVLILGRFANETQIATFNIAFRIALLTSIPILAIETVVGPQIAVHFKAQEHKELREHTQKATALTVLLSIPIIAILILFGQPLLTIFGHEFTDAFPLVMVLLLGQAINIVTGPVGLVLTMTDKQATYTKIFIFMAALTLCVNIFAISQWGIYGAAWAAVASITIKNILFYLAVKHHFGFSSINLRYFVQQPALLIKRIVP